MRSSAQIFLCYAHQDQAQVEDLYLKLRDAGFKPWMDNFDLVGGEQWKPAIEKAIRKSHFFIACLSKSSVNRRGFLRREINIALDIAKEQLETDIYIIPLRLEECDLPESIGGFQWIDYFKDGGYDRVIKTLHNGMDRLGLTKPVKLRSQPIDGLSRAEVIKMLKEMDFCDAYDNRAGNGLHHQYEVNEHESVKVVVDCTTGLTWQQSGSKIGLAFAQANEYISELNQQRHAGYDNWRLPTLEEAMSLVEPAPSSYFSISEGKAQDVFINLVFDSRQQFIWTSDKEEFFTISAWCVGFDLGYCFGGLMNHARFVRAVRSG